MTIHDDLTVRHGFVPDQPIDATQVMPTVRPSVRYPDPGPDLTAIKHTRWPDEPSPDRVDAAAVWEQGGAILRRLAIVEAKLDQLLLAVARQNGAAS